MIYEACTCLDCGIDTQKINEYYMLRQDVWDEVVSEDRGFLCIKCFEIRLQKRLVPGDFIDCQLNEIGGIFEKSYRLLNRMEKIV